MFSLEKLKVYDRALASVAQLAQLSARLGQPPRRRGLAGMPELDQVRDQVRD